MVWVVHDSSKSRTSGSLSYSKLKHLLKVYHFSSLLNYISLFIVVDLDDNKVMNVFNNCLIDFSKVMDEVEEIIWALARWLGILIYHPCVSNRTATCARNAANAAWFAVFGFQLQRFKAWLGFLLPQLGFRYILVTYAVSFCPIDVGFYGFSVNIYLIRVE